jgi:nitrous oxidase accessory protein NosD
VFGATVSQNRAGNSDTGVALFDTAIARGNRLFGDGRRLFDGIYVCGTGSRVQENVIDGSQESGVNVVGPGFGCAGTGHAVRENTVNEGCAGILVDTGTSGNTLAGNVFYNVTNSVANGSSCGAPFAAARPSGPGVGARRPGPRAVE